MFRIAYLSLAMAAYPPMGETVVVEPTAEHTHTVIFIHGITCSGGAMKYLFDDSVPGKGCCGAKGALEDPNRKTVLPTAPYVWNDMWNEKTHSWFNLAYPTHEDYQRWLGLLLQLNVCQVYTEAFATVVARDQVLELAQIILDMAEKEAALLATEESDGFDKVFIGGFSQGAMTTMSVLMQHYSQFDKPIGGYFVLSGAVSILPLLDHTCHAFSVFPPQPSGLEKAMMDEMPLYLAHGLADPTIPFWLAMLADTTIWSTYWMSGLLTTHFEKDQTHVITDGECEKLNSWMADALDE